MRARALLLTTVLRSSTPVSASVPVPGLSATMPKLSALASTSVFIPGLFAVVPELFAAISGLSISVPGLFAAVPELSVVMPGSSAPTFASVFMPGLFALVLPSVPVLPESSSLLFLALFLPKTPTPNLAAERQKLDDTISGWSGRSKKASSEELYSGRIIRAASKDTFSPKIPLFPPLFPSSTIGKRKLDKTFINTWPLADNHVKKEVNLSFAMCRCLSAVKLNRLCQIDLLERRPACIVKTISLTVAIFWDPNFVPCPRHTLNLATKLGLKTKNFSNALVKERIQLSWANRTIGQLDTLLKKNLG